MKQYLVYILYFVVFSSVFPIISNAKNFNKTDVVNLSLGKFGSTPNLLHNSSFSRSASSALIENHCFSIQYRNNYFLPQLGTSNLNFTIATEKINTGIYFEHYGLSVYSEFSGGLSFSKYIKPYFAFNISGEYFGIYQESEKGVISSAMAHISLIVFPTKSLSIGFSSYNISFSSIKTAYETKKLPTLFCLGLAYNHKNKLCMSLEIGKEMKGPIYYSLSLEYLPVKKFALRVGMSGKNKSLAPTAGFGFKAGIFGLDFGVKYDYNLGFIIAAGIHFCKDKKP